MEIRSRIGVLLFSCPRPFSAAECVATALRSGIVLADADLCAWDLGGVSFRGCKLDFIDLQGARLENADFRGCSLKGAKLNRAKCVGALLDGANLAGAELCDADLCGVQAQQCLFTGADLRGAVFDQSSKFPFDLVEARRRGMRLLQSNT